MRGQRGSGGVISGDTDLGDLRGHPQSSMSWVCETPGWVHGWMANPRAAAVAAQSQLLLHLMAEHRRHRDGDEQAVRGRVSGCIVVGGVVGAPGEQDVALVEPRVPEAVEDQYRPVHRPVR